MYYKHKPESMFSKVHRYLDQGLKIYGTARGVYEVGSGLVSAARTAYQVAGPALAIL